MRVTVNANGREVTIECDSTNTTPDAVADKALEVWLQTAGGGGGLEGPAYGFSNDRRGVNPVTPTGNGQYNGTGMPEVIA